VCRHDQRILDDYALFRKVRAKVYICPNQWKSMTKKTKMALITMIDLAQKAVREGKL